MDPRHPIGPFALPSTVTQTDLEGWIAVLEAAPDHLRAAAKGLNGAQLGTPYREGGWTGKSCIICPTVI